MQTQAQWLQVRHQALAYQALAKDYLHDAALPKELECPIGYHLLARPVRLGSDGLHVYEDRLLRKWLAASPTDPMTRAPVSRRPLVAAVEVRQRADALRRAIKRQARAEGQSETVAAMTIAAAWRRYRDRHPALAQPRRAVPPLLPGTVVRGITYLQVARRGLEPRRSGARALAFAIHIARPSAVAVSPVIVGAAMRRQTAQR